MVCTVNVGEWDLIEVARDSRAYQPLLRRLPEQNLGSLRKLHDTLASSHQATKELCFSSTNITSVNYFIAPYRGMTSGRSGSKKQYYKSAQWVNARDDWRRKNLHNISGGAYSVINICSRLFPHDSFDITIAAASLDKIASKILAQIAQRLTSFGLRIVYRGFPSQLIRSLSELKSISRNLGIQPVVITTGMAPTDQELTLLRETFGATSIHQEYGAQDLGIQLFSCRHCGQFHFENPRCILTLVDGKLYSSDLFSIDQPVIGCYTGDLGLASSERCSATGQKGFSVKQQPHVTSTLLGNASSLLNRANVREFDILLGINADAQLVQIRDEALAGVGLDNEVRHFSVDRVYDKLKNNQLSLLRLDLNRSLSALKRLEWQKKQLSLVSFLLAHSMILDDENLTGYIMKWQEIETTSLGLVAVIQDVYERISTSDNDNTVEVFNLTSEVIKFIIASQCAVEDLLTNPTLLSILELIWQSIARNGSMPKCFAITEAIKTYMLSYVWLKHPHLMDEILDSYEGSANYNILFVEYLQSAGFLSKS